MRNKNPYTLALHWLGYRDYSKAQMVDRLQRSGYEAESARNTVERLAREGWIDDTRLAYHVVEHCLESKNMGPALIRHQLVSKGLAPEIYEPVLQERVSGIDWLKIAEVLRERYDMNEPRERRRFGRYLIRRGFPVSLAWQLAGWEENGADPEGDY